MGNNSSSSSSSTAHHHHCYRIGDFVKVPGWNHHQSGRPNAVAVPVSASEEEGCENENEDESFNHDNEQQQQQRRKRCLQVSPDGQSVFWKTTIAIKTPAAF